MPLNKDLTQDPFFVNIWELAEKSATEYVDAKFKAEGYDTKYKAEYDAKFKDDFNAIKTEMNAKFQSDIDAKNPELDAKFKAEMDAKNAELDAELDTYAKNKVLAIENMLKLDRFSAKEIADLLVVPLAFVLDIQSKMTGVSPKKATKSRKK